MASHGSHHFQKLSELSKALKALCGSVSMAFNALKNFKVYRILPNSASPKHLPNPNHPRTPDFPKWQAQVL